MNKPPKLSNKWVKSRPFMRWAALYSLASFLALLFLGNQMPELIRKVVATTFLLSFFGVPLIAIYQRRNMTQFERDNELAPWTEKKMKHRINLILGIAVILILLLSYLFPEQFFASD